MKQTRTILTPLTLDHGTFFQIVSSRPGVVSACEVEGNTAFVSLAPNLEPTDWVVAVEQNYHSDFAVNNHLVYGNDVDPDEILSQPDIHRQDVSGSGEGIAGTTISGLVVR